MTKLYRVDVTIAATVYVKADSESEANDTIAALVGAEIPADLPISGLDYDDPALPNVSLSPAMTMHASDGNAELVEDLNPDD